MSSRLLRREFLKRLGLCAGFAPFIPVLEAEAQAAVPRRLVVLHSPNGVGSMTRWRPTGTESAFTLGEVLSPLAAHQQSLIVLDGLYDPGGGGSHNRAQADLLTGVAARYLGGVDDYIGMGMSVDQHIARTVGAQTRFASLQLGVTAAKEFSNQGPYTGGLAYAGAQQPLPAENNPQAAFNRLFSSTPAPTADQRSVDRRSVLDYVLRDLNRVRQTVGAADRIKVERHLEHVRELEKSLTAAAPVATCASPSVPGALDWRSFGNVPALLKAQADIAAAALACDLTRVITLQVGCTGWTAPFTWLGQTMANHDLNHFQRVDETVAACRWLAQYGFGYLLDRLKQTTQSDGKSLLHHSAVVWMNEFGDGDKHVNRPFPVVLAGNAGGTWRTGRFLSFSAGRAHTQLLVSLCQAMGLSDTSYGNASFPQGPLPGLV